MPPPTGPGCSRFGLTSVSAIPRTLREELGAGAASSHSSCPSCASSFPISRSRLARAGGGSLPPLRRRDLVPHARRRERPIVLVLDDLHAADEPSLLLLQFVAAELGDSRLLVVGAYRDVDPTLRDPLASTGRVGGASGRLVGSRSAVSRAGRARVHLSDRRARGGPGDRRGDLRPDGGERPVRRRGDATADRRGRARARGGGGRGIPQGVRDGDRSPDRPAVRGVRANADDGLRAGA